MQMTGVRRARFECECGPCTNVFLRAKAFLFSLDMCDADGECVFASLWRDMYGRLGLAFGCRCSGKGLRWRAFVRAYIIFMIIVFYCKLRWNVCVCVFPIFSARVATFAFLADVRCEQNLFEASTI